MKQSFLFLLLDYALTPTPRKGRGRLPVMRASYEASRASNAAPIATPSAPNSAATILVDSKHG